MSYEGYVEYICEDGHYYTIDVYDTIDAFDETLKSKSSACKFCDKAIRYIHHVDQTNGYEESDLGTCDGKKKLLGYQEVWRLGYHRNNNSNGYSRKVAVYQPDGDMWIDLKISED